jgi:uncharacterized protein
MVLTVRIAPELLAKAEQRALQLGLDRARYVRSLIQEDLKAAKGKPGCRFASEDLVGAFRLGGSSATNERVPSGCACESAMKRIADRGLIVGLLASDHPCHAWAAAAFRKYSPFHTCDAVLAEACSFFDKPTPVLTLVARGDLILDFDLAEQLPQVLALCSKYADQPMDLADACVVRMTELNVRCKVWTVDRGDFTVYRRHSRQMVPCEFPARA